MKRSGEDRRSRTAPTEIRIRDATEADLPAIVWFRAHSPTQYPIWVADLDGAIAGWLSFREFLPRCAYRGTVEISVYVSEKFRRRGVGKRLLQEAIARGPQLEMHSLVGLIFGHNEPSIALFQVAGFERWGLLPDLARVDQTPRDLTIFGRHV